MARVTLLAGLICATVFSGSIRFWARQAPAGERDFKHASGIHPHLASSSKVKGAAKEFERDCRGCHDYVSREGKLDPEATCRPCHYVDNDRQKNGNPNLFYNGSKWQPEQDGYQRLEAGTPFGHLDNHVQHINLPCQECHSIEADPVSVELGVRPCIDCHDPDLAKKKLEKNELRHIKGQDPKEFAKGLNAGFCDQLNRSPYMKPEGAVKFRHSDHLVDAKEGLALTRDKLVGDKITCARCHLNVFDSGPLEQVWKYSPEACTECHYSSTSKQPALEIKGAAVARQSGRAADTFFHGDHLRGQARDPQRPRAKPQLFEDLKQQGCYACHQYELDGDADRIVLREEPTYQWCIKCHDGAEWQSKHHGEAVAARWTKCDDCHVFPSNDMKIDRAMVKVDRPQEPKFQSESQQHEFIAGDNIDKREDCAKCHAKWPTEMPSRVNGRDFKHDSHLSLQASTSECRECHREIEKATGSADITVVFDRAVFDRKDCEKCHKGSVIKLAEADAQAQRSVLEFSHATHLEKSYQGKKVDCINCHDPQNEAKNGRIGVIDKVQGLCEPCHNHDGRAKETGDADRVEVKSCALCHKPSEKPADKASVPALKSKGNELKVPTIVEVSAQLHEPDRRCKDCHVQLKPSSVPKWTDHFSASGAVDAVHPNGSWKSLPGATVQDVCLTCHWAKRTKGGMTDRDPDDAATRAQFIKNFPRNYGIDAARNFK